MSETTLSVAALNALPETDARVAFGRCCGAWAWGRLMAARRPFADRAAVIAAAESIWKDLPPEVWREAFHHHPRIGDLDSLRKRFAATADLASREQASVATAAAATLEALAEGNRAYEEKFGYIFIICATGRSADEMLAALRVRLANDAATEIRNAGGEQMKITRLRLERMLAA
ncbi:MAG: 2-oxo-4-hydroxy-4-carboxy-5-ureidoimidazoline decarboxylase [Candidatus Eisenbacteria bacterium]|uniref:2-oxo-4-hydroxy-4-carboxy-5-ureidoimidazoline decarboxylase n=1 Tax=Eiseniibacteriota bacterium TaxID=2212470 RepID=A0A9D6L864_UNCEI|nr:2-oxo-4-hydroxy-4-carboxy-5-ureidoimidazoline decarboxylase [Candidatus Eisenbacteria bacterium]MBI3538705.1 2-oxo-4-hydroxy-4-carboxy-5-ureidoimidazoline decarboxylase [Candidatus Eisenbacteria bacterium]